MPYYCSPRMTAWLKRQGYDINHKRVERLMRLMGIQAIYPKPNTTRKSQEHKVYPYLLRGVEINCPNQVWSTDITYIRMNKGFIYLAAILDWYSRYVLSWRVSITVDTEFCIEALQEALEISSPEIFNTDQGSQFTCTKFTKVLEAKDVKISMDGRGRVFDNILIERLWRSVKYEEVYIKDYQTVAEAIKGLKQYFEKYNKERLHQSLNYMTPYEVYWQESGEVATCKQLVPKIEMGEDIPNFRNQGQESTLINGKNGLDIGGRFS